MTIANRKPLFVGQIGTTVTAIPATANTNRDGTGTITTVFTGATNTGSLLEVLKVKATVTTAAAVLNVFYKPSGGSFLFVGAFPLVTVVTPSSTVDAWEGYYSASDMPMRVGPGDIIGVSTTIAQAYVCNAQGGTLENKDTSPVAQ